MQDQTPNNPRSDPTVRAGEYGASRSDKYLTRVPKMFAVILRARSGQQAESP